MRVPYPTVKLLPPLPAPRPARRADDTLGRGMDLALVTAVFLGIGWGLDRAFDTKPWFMIGCVLFALIGQFVAMWYRYDAAMRGHEEERRARIHGHDLSTRPTTERSVRP